MRLGHGPDASVSQYPTRQFVPSVWVQATYHARVCVTTCYQSSGTLTRTNHIVRCAGLSCPRNYAISGLCKRRTLFVDAFISAIEWPRIPAWCLKNKINGFASDISNICKKKSFIVVWYPISSMCKMFEMYHIDNRKEGVLWPVRKRSMSARHVVILWTETIRRRSIQGWSFAHHQREYRPDQTDSCIK